MTSTTLSERAMLVTLNISQWTARKLDRDETTALNRSHGLTVEAARVNKNLFPLSSPLERVHQTTGAIRKDFSRRTLPWGIDGVQILKASAYVDFTAQVNKWQDEFEAAVGDFITAYPVLLEEAQVLLGSLFKAEDYPSISELRHRFAFAIRFMPVPDKQDWRIDVGDEARKRLEEDISQRIAETESTAMTEAWKRIYDVIAHAQERLRNPEAIFRDSLVDNAVELCGLLPGLNITDDPKLEKARQQLEGVLAPFIANKTPLRDDLKVRADAAKKLAGVMAKMGGMYAPPVALAEAA